MKNVISGLQQAAQQIPHSRVAGQPGAKMSKSTNQCNQPVESVVSDGCSEQRPSHSSGPAVATPLLAFSPFVRLLLAESLLPILVALVHRVVSRQLEGEGAAAAAAAEVESEVAAAV